MRSIFFRIYSGILCGVILIGASAVLGYRYWHEGQLNQYLLENSRGTLLLIAEGLNRHKDDRREQWLSLSQRVTSLSIEVVSSPPALAEVVRAEQGGTGRWRLELDDTDRRILWIQLKPGATEWMRVVLAENGINEQLMRGSLLLILNELGRYPKPDRPAVLTRLQPDFVYPLQWLSRDNVSANYLQQRALMRGDTVVDLQVSESGERAMRAVAPIGNSGDFLQLGPVPLFESFPRVLVISVGLAALALLAGICFLLVRPLERRLNLMSSEVEGIRMSGETPAITVEGDDALTALSEKINAMSGRIHQLLKAQRELNRAVSHELKTPLARLEFRRELALQRLSMLDVGPDAVEPVEQHLIGMETSLRELNSLVEEILIYASLESAQPELNISVIPLNAMLDELVTPMQVQFPEMAFQLEGDASLSLQADAHYLKRALQNLLGNAQRYAQHQIVVRFESVAGQVMVYVEDDGPGIPDDQWQQVLEPFSRAESSRNRKTGGSGLGLAIVNQIMRWHGGEVRIGASMLGGVRATLILPVSQPGQPAESASDPSVTSAVTN